MTTTGTPSIPRSLALDACPIAQLVSVVSSRWKTPILWVLQHHGPQRSKELRRQLGPVTAKVLTARLRQLERDGLVRAGPPAPSRRRRTTPSASSVSH